MRFSSKSRAACFCCFFSDLLIWLNLYDDQIACQCWCRQSANTQHTKLKSGASNLHGAGASNLQDNREAAEKQIQLLGTLKGQWMRPFSTAGNSGEVQGMARKKEIEEEIRLIKKQKSGLYEDLKEGMLEQEDFEGEWGRLAERQLWCEKKIKNMGYIDTDRKSVV